MAGNTSKMLLPEPFTGSNDFESYVTHFELLANLQKWKRMEGTTGNEHEVDDRPHYFALRLQKSAIDFYRTLSEDTRKSYDETVAAFRQHYNEKPVVFRGRLARRVQQPGEKLTDFLGDLQQLALKAYPNESAEIREHLILRGFLEGIQNTQVRLDLRKSLGDEDMKVSKALEKALHLEAVTRIEEEEHAPKVSAVQPDLSQRLLESMDNLVRTLSQDGTLPRGGDVVRKKFSENNEGFRSRRDFSGNRRDGSRGSRKENWNRNNKSEFRERSAEAREFSQERRKRAPTPHRSSREQTPDRNREKKGAVEFDNDTCRKCGRRGHWQRDCGKCFECGSTQHLKRNCPYLN